MLYKLRIFVRNPRARIFFKKSRSIPLENNAEKNAKNKQGRKYHWCISQIINTTIYKLCFLLQKTIVNSQHKRKNLNFAPKPRF